MNMALDGGLGGGVHGMNMALPDHLSGGPFI